MSSVVPGDVIYLLNDESEKLYLPYHQYTIGYVSTEFNKFFSFVLAQVHVIPKAQHFLSSP